MPFLDLSFEWPVDGDGYSIVDHKPKPPKKRSPRKPSEREGARIITGEWIGPHIIRRGGPLRTARPLEFHRTLFMEFARLDDSDGACLGFANRFGLLGMFPDEKADDRVGPKGESLLLWKDHIANMRRAVDAWEASPDAFASSQELTITQLDVSLVPIDGRPTLRIRPRSLIGAIRLQFAQAVATGLDIRTCDHCGKIFETGGMGRTRKARFCSDRCRNNYHAARRKVT